MQLLKSSIFLLTTFSITNALKNDDGRQDDAKKHVSSTDLHAIAMPRHKAVGMWLPSQVHLDKIRQHRHSFYAPPKGKDISLTLKQIPLSGKSIHGWHQLQTYGPAKNISINTDTLQGEVRLRKRYAYIAVAVKAAGIAITFLANAICTFIANTSASTKSKVACFIIVNLLAFLATWGNSFFYSSFVQSSGAAVQGLVANAISVVQNVAKREIESNIIATVPATWYAGHEAMLQSIYDESLEHDQRMISSGRAQYDQNTGQLLSHWDVIMSHVHPVRHSFVKGIHTTIWHEAHEQGHRRHSFTSFQDMHAEHTFETPSGTQFSWKSSRKSKRQCEGSDMGADEAPYADYCEDGSSIGAKGIYSGYDYTGTADEAEASHLQLGNDSYAEEVSQLEGDLMFLGNLEGICENVTDQSQGNRQIYIGLKQLEGPDDSYMGYGDCHDVDDGE